jgi:hypothetical protein
MCTTEHVSDADDIEWEDTEFTMNFEPDYSDMLQELSDEEISEAVYYRDRNI